MAAVGIRGPIGARVHVLSPTFPSGDVEGAPGSLWPSSRLQLAGCSHPSQHPSFPLSMLHCVVRGSPFSLSTAVRIGFAKRADLFR